MDVFSERLKQVEVLLSQKERSLDNGYSSKYFESDTDIEEEDHEFSSVDDYFQYSEALKKKTKVSSFHTDEFFDL